MGTQIATLLTNFGTSDAYVAAVKGALLSVHPKLNVVDLNHEVRNHDVASGAFLLAEVVPYFPKGTDSCCGHRFWRWNVS
jgi:S-adenosylmethionine hydrolase